MMPKTLVHLIAALVVLATVTPEIVRLAQALTPLVSVLAVALIAWQLAQYYTRR